MKRVTAWQKLNPITNAFEHNHIEADWCVGSIPTPNFPLEFTPTGKLGDDGLEKMVVSESYKNKLLKWSSIKWKKQFGYLDMSGKYQPIRA